MNVSSSTTFAEATRLNAICPYFTMFPLDFPLGVLEKYAKPDDCVLDPFCGRGTTNFAARLLGLKTIGIDASRVAIAATQAKLVAPNESEIVGTAKTILSLQKQEYDVPKGEFWKLAYHEEVLHKLCRIRKTLLEENVSEQEGAALRGIILGALHGPIGQTKISYFSNQSPRTYGPKPAYAVKFWKERELAPPRVNVLSIIAERAHRYYGRIIPRVLGSAIKGDSRSLSTVTKACELVGKVDWVITSPPYYGLRTYLPDQWIRNWFLGGSSAVDYSTDGQLSHNGRDRFVADLRKVWANVGMQCRPGARLVVRFGSLGGQKIGDPVRLMLASFNTTSWVATDVLHAGNASRGRRQADTFRRKRNEPCEEVDLWAKWLP